MNARIVYFVVVFAVALSGLLGSEVVVAGDEWVFLPLTAGGAGSLGIAESSAKSSQTEDDLAGRPWNNHRAPFDFTFGNHKDQHQQSKQMPASNIRGEPLQKNDDKDRLRGFLYVDYTGELSEEGIPIAKHVDCNAADAECEVGWGFDGVAAKATLLSKGQGRPQWCIDDDNGLLEKGYTHFHWLRLEGEPGLRVGQVRQGYLLRLVARDEFVFMHSGNRGSGGHGGDSGPPDDTGGSGGGCSHDDGTSDDGGCSGGGGDSGPPDDTGGSGCGCSHDDGNSSGSHGVGFPIQPGPDAESHRNVSLCTPVTTQ